MTLELHRIVHLPQKVAAEFHKIMHLPREVTAEPHQIMKSFVVDPNENTMLWQLALHHFRNRFASLWGLQGLEPSALHRRYPAGCVLPWGSNAAPRTMFSTKKVFLKQKLSVELKRCRMNYRAINHIHIIPVPPPPGVRGQFGSNTNKVCQLGIHSGGWSTCPLASSSRSNPYHIAYIGCSTCKGSLLFSYSDGVHSPCHPAPLPQHSWWVSPNLP